MFSQNPTSKGHETPKKRLAGCLQLLATPSGGHGANVSGGYPNYTRRSEWREYPQRIGIFDHHSPVDIFRHLFRNYAHNILIRYYMSQPYPLWHMSCARPPNKRVLKRLLQSPMNRVANVLNCTP